MNSKLDESPAAPTGVQKRWIRVIVWAFAALIVGLTAQQALYYFAARPDPNDKPPERQGKNAPFITTPDPVVDEMVALVELTENDLVYDLGCGDGRLVITAALKSGCQGVGFDIDPQLVALAEENAAENGVADRVRFAAQDVFTVDLSQADVALVYLLPWMLEKLIPQFDQMKPGARIVTHDFWIEGVEPQKVTHVQVTETSPNDVYLYTVPLKKNPNMERGRPPRLPLPK